MEAYIIIDFAGLILLLGSPDNPAIEAGNVIIEGCVL